MKRIDKKTISTILYRFPKTNIKNLSIFSQGKNTNTNKVLFNESASYFVLKPKGKRGYLWFTYIEKRILCILCFINKDITDYTNEFFEYDVNFDNTLCYNNVLLYGYYFTNNNNNNNNNNKNNHSNKKLTTHYFVMENVFNYNIYNHIIEANNYNNIFENKIKLFNKIFDTCVHNMNNVIKLVCPIIVTSSGDVFKKINTLNYNLHSIAVYNKYKYLGNYLLENRKKQITATFKISPCINEDLYSLYVLDDQNLRESFYDLALINNYKTSVFMNGLFRNIKENRNLDFLEESDDEEEFENIKPDKFVNLDKSCIIECEFNYKFRKWVPRKLSQNKISNKLEISLAIKHNRN